jgi:predicted RNase H-like HicB family nuclease
VDTYAVTLERGRDGSYVAWVDELPGCAVRAASKDEVLARLPDAIAEFVAWTGEPPPAAPRVSVTEEVESAIEADEDTEVLVAADRAPLTDEDWLRLQPLLERSRAELLARLGDADLGAVREEIEHVAFVELMYAMWTFDLQSREGLGEFLAWTRGIAAERMRALAARRSDELTWADWGGAPRPEPWTPRKAARRLLWHELLHLRAIERS